MQLTLLVPELIWPEPDDRDIFDGLDSPALDSLLARSRLARRPPQSFEATLSDTFTHPEGAPYAAFRLIGEAQDAVDADECSWICCDPVHLRFHQENLILAEMGHFGISFDEAQALVEALNTHLANIGHFHAFTAERWYLQLTDTLLLDGFDAPPLSTVAGRRIERLLAESTQAKGMRKLFNEIQMILHAHPINQQRENEGRMTINSLWLWGAGKLPPRADGASPSHFDGVWSHTPLARGLARFASIPTHQLPLDAAKFLENAAPGTRHLVVLEDLLGPVQYEKREDYRNALTQLEEHWFAPLQKQLSAGKISQLRIEASTAYATLYWECTRSSQWKFWKRPQALVARAKVLASE